MKPLRAPAEAALAPAFVRGVRRGLLDAWRRGRRDLPWRRTRDPWAILVSESMLQQTRVETVVPYYERFLRRFPTPRALARAHLEEVLAAWSGLGYYRRARHLLEAARAIESRFRGRFPETEEEVLSLPGVGRYTSGALLSIAFGKPRPVLDGNAARVLCRLLAWEGDPRSGPLARRLWGAARSLVDPEEPGAFNQALMELGALVCKPRRPDCPRCPLRRLCRARALGLEEGLPTRAPRPRARRVAWTAALVRRRDRVLLVRRPREGLLAGLWEVPTVAGGGSKARRALESRLRALVGRGTRLGPPIATLRHGIENLSIRIRLHEADADGVRRPPRSARWAPLSSARNLPLTGATRKALALV